jgi:hypothetical protein
LDINFLLCVIEFDLVDQFRSSHYCLPLSHPNEIGIQGDHAKQASKLLRRNFFVVVIEFRHGPFLPSNEVVGSTNWFE